MHPRRPVPQKEYFSDHLYWDEVDEPDIDAEECELPLHHATEPPGTHPSTAEFGLEQWTGADAFPQQGRPAVTVTTC
jgi:hypothetical protein